MNESLAIIVRELKQLSEQTPLRPAKAVEKPSEILAGLHRRDVELGGGQRVRAQFSRTILPTRSLHHLSLSRLPELEAPDDQTCETICQAFFLTKPTEVPSVLGNCRQFIWR